MKGLNKKYKEKLFPILFPGIIYVVIVFVFLFFVMTDSLNRFFPDDYGILVGSRWFSYQYTGEKYFHPATDEKYIGEYEALDQMEKVLSVRSYSSSEEKLVMGLIDSFARNSSIYKNGEKQINALELNIRLDRIK
jgi:K+-transporting ATPase c subunit